MSEEERERREKYKRNRKRWLIIQLVVICCVSLATIALFIANAFTEKTYYVNYTESAQSDYTVQISQNDYYDTTDLPSGQTYVSSLVEYVYADFSYGIKTDSETNVTYNYTTKTIASLTIYERNASQPIFTKEYVITPSEEQEFLGKNLQVLDSVIIDYGYYNGIAKNFIATYHLSNATCNLSVKMILDVEGDCSEFENSNTSSHYVSINIPLAQNTFTISSQASVPSAESRVLACGKADLAKTLKDLAVYLAFIDGLLIITFIAVLFLTRNHDINYSIKVKNIEKSYKSFIQKTFEPFDTKGYQVIKLTTFEEMLGIRDTISSPILMNENEDKTCTTFTIPTQTNIIYVYELKVEDYDKIYANENKIEEKAEEKTAPVVLEDSVVDVKNEEEEVLPVETALQESEQDEEEVSAKPVVIYDEQSEVASTIVEGDEKSALEIKLSRSFEANLIQADDEVKEYYSDIKNLLLSYKGVKSRFSWKYDSYSRGRDQLVKLKIRGKTVYMFIALNPEDYDKARFYQTAVTVKKLLDVPMQVKIKSKLGLKKAKELIEDVMKKFEIEKDKDAVTIDYAKQYPNRTDKTLIAKGLIKKL